MARTSSEWQAHTAPAAYGLSRSNVSTKGVAIFVILLLITQMIPGIVIANGLFPLYNNLHLINTVPGLIFADASHGIPFCILLLRAFMQNIPHSLMEAGALAGMDVRVACPPEHRPDRLIEFGAQVIAEYERLDSASLPAGTNRLEEAVSDAREAEAMSSTSHV